MNIDHKEFHITSIKWISMNAWDVSRCKFCIAICVWRRENIILFFFPDCNWTDTDWLDAGAYCLSMCGGTLARRTYFQIQFRIKPNICEMMAYSTFRLCLVWHGFCRALVRCRLLKLCRVQCCTAWIRLNVICEKEEKKNNIQINVIRWVLYSTACDVVVDFIQSLLLRLHFFVCHAVANKNVESATLNQEVNRSRTDETKQSNSFLTQLMFISYVI